MMKLFSILLAAAALATGVAAPPAFAQTRGADQASAREEMRAGRNLPIRAILQRIVPRYERQGYEYLTFEYDGNAAVYRLKFIQDGSMLFVDVDARSGRILRERR